MTKRLFPVTIITTRYSGVYEGGDWAAFKMRAHEVPRAATGDDSECMAWWNEYGAGVGVGPSPEAALADLQTRQWDLTAPARSLAEITTYLENTVGQRVTAAVAGLNDVQQLAKYIRKSNPEPDDIEERRLREGYKIVRVIVDAYDATTARAWLFGTNSRLDDRAPIEVLGQATDSLDFTALVKAARNIAGSKP